MGLMLTGMYFSTSATANTTLNVTSAVITNDIYKGIINPHASDKKLIQVARLSGLLLGSAMIGIALLVPAAGGMIEVVLSIAAITGGPSLLPSIWALFSRKLDGKTAYIISGISLGVNLLFKFIIPLISTLKLTRSQEMLLGVGLPFIMLLVYEFIIAARKGPSEDYLRYQAFRKQQQELQVHEEEAVAVRSQNLFGLRVIAFALAFTGLLLYILCILAATGKTLVALIATAVLLTAIIPLRAARKLKRSVNIPAPERRMQEAGH